MTHDPLLEGESDFTPLVELVQWFTVLASKCVPKSWYDEGKEEVDNKVTWCKEPDKTQMNQHYWLVYKTPAHYVIYSKLWAVGFRNKLLPHFLVGYASKNTRWVKRTEGL
jgi:hypothetical protein